VTGSAAGPVVLTCGGAPPPAVLTGLPGGRCAGRPARAEVDALAAGARRVVVVGDDADLAAVLVRLLRDERLDVELAYVPAAPTAATRVWGLPHGALAATLALTGVAACSVLVRDDNGGVLVGGGTLRGVEGVPLRGEAYADDTLVFSGEVSELRVRPAPAGPGVQVVAVGVPRLRRLRRRLRSGGIPGGAARGSEVAAGAVAARAVQLGSTGCEVVRDGVRLEQAVTRWALYRHTDDWLLVRPG